MKKLIAITSALAMMLVLASCGGDTTDASSEATSTTPSTTPSTTISIPTPSEPPAPVESNNLALREGATWIDMNTGKTAGDEGYLGYYDGVKDLSYAFDANVADGWQVAASYEEKPYVEGDEIPEGWYQSDATIYKMQSFEDGALWMGVSFEEAVTVDSLVIKFEHNAGVYSVEEGGYRIETTVDGETWATLEGATIERVDDTAANLITDTVSIEATEIKGVRVVIIKGTTKYAPKVCEFEIYAPEEAEGTESTEEAESTDETVAE